MKARLDPQLRAAQEAPFPAQLLLGNAAVSAKVQLNFQKQVIFSQGDPATTLFYIREGRVRLTLLSSEGKAATVTILGEGEFLGEECFVPCYGARLASAVAITDCCLLKIGRDEMLAALESDHVLAASFTQYLLLRKIHVEDNLAD